MLRRVRWRRDAALRGLAGMEEKGSAAQPVPPAMAWRHGPGIPYGLIALLLPAFLFVYGIGAFPLHDTNEGLYAEVAREMLSTGQYVVPHLNGVPYLEKPPLLYWLISLSMSCLGPTAAAARAVSAAATWLLCTALFRFCSLHGSARAGCFASVGLASMLPVAIIAHFVLFDPLLASLLGMALLSYLHSYLTGSRPAHVAAAFLLGLAVLEKGFVALALAGGTIGLFLLMIRDRAGWRRLFDKAGLAMLAGVAAPWHVAAALRQPGFAWFYFVNEHVLRFLGQREPQDFHRGPAWFYLLRVPLMLLPWTPFMLLVARPTTGYQPAKRTIVRFCQAAILFPLMFFSLSQAKADYYQLVAAPAFAVWLAIEIDSRIEQRGDRRLALCWGVAAATALMLVLASQAALLRATVPSAAAWDRQSLGWWAWGWGALAAGAALLFGKLRSLRARELALLGVAMAAVPGLVLLSNAGLQRRARDSSWEVARLITAHPGAARTVFIYRDFEDAFSTLPFYLGHPVPVIDSTSRDLEFGCKAVPGASCVTADALRRLCRHAAPLAVAVHAPRAGEFLALTRACSWQAERAGNKIVFFAQETTGLPAKPPTASALTSSPAAGSN